VCGEDCPPPGYCLECPEELLKFSQNIVDFIYFTKLTENDPSENPIIVLGCGHPYTVSYMDAQLHLEQFYEKDETTGEWIETVPLDYSGMKGAEREGRREVRMEERREEEAREEN
jgi:hypothetical protein